MPTKGFFTQSMTILLRNPVSIEAIGERLVEFQIVKRSVAPGPWPLGFGPSVLVAWRPEVNGYVSVDMLDRRWPDHMGDTKTEPEVLAAWGMGHFGPGTWPGALGRACQHAFTWPEAGAVAAQHQAFVRILCSYVLGAGGDAPVMPADYRPLPELEFVTRIAAALVNLPGALCYFNPNGECVLSARDLAESLRFHASAKLVPLPVWSNVRFFTLSDVLPKWNFMDTVGMRQLDAPDHEACYELSAHAPGEVGNFLRNASSYVVQNGPVIRDGDTMNGPGGVNWQQFAVKESRVPPPRAVIRWFPQDGRKVPAGFAAWLASPR